MEVKHRARSLTLRYVTLEDRIEWLSHCENNITVSAWVSRRLLIELLPQLFEWLGKNNGRQLAPQASGRTAAEKTHIHRFDHEIAQRQVKTVTAKLPKNLKTEQFLLRHMDFKATKAGVIIGLAAEKNSTLVAFSASLPETHKVIGELLRVSDDAGWEVPNPWYASSGQSSEAVLESIH